MWYKKKKYVILATAISALCYIFYQIHFLSILYADNSNLKNFKIQFTKDSIVRNVSDDRQVLQIEPIENSDETKHVMDLRYFNQHGLIRGLLIRQMRDYKPSEDRMFVCVNSKQRIHYSYVNDDFCDCEDQSDEPSTNACSDNYFFCDTQYKRPGAKLNKVPSSRVNDGICDCCDGSDEFDSVVKKRSVVCPNVCLIKQKIYKL